jgi:DNA-binding IclR family transcriptional regulator
VKNKPPYSIESVDNALHILQLLRDSGQARVSDVAGELGIARSTAHRLLAMLVYRDFAIQAEDRSYLPGPALSASSPSCPTPSSPSCSAAAAVAARPRE